MLACDQQTQPTQCYYAAIKSQLNHEILILTEIPQIENLIACSACMIQASNFSHCMPASNPIERRNFQAIGDIASWAHVLAPISLFEFNYDGDYLSLHAWHQISIQKHEYHTKISQIKHFQNNIQNICSWFFLTFCLCFIPHSPIAQHTYLRWLALFSDRWLLYLAKETHIAVQSNLSTLWHCWLVSTWQAHQIGLLLAAAANRKRFWERGVERESSEWDCSSQSPAWWMQMQIVQWPSQQSWKRVVQERENGRKEKASAVQVEIVLWWWEFWEWFWGEARWGKWACNVPWWQG